MMTQSGIAKMWFLLFALTIPFTARPAAASDDPTGQRIGRSSYAVVAFDPSDTNRPTAIAEWIVQLDDDNFDVREDATENLMGAGKAAVDATAAAATGESLEVTERAVRILKALSLAMDADASNAARAALNRLALSNHPAAARRARLAIRVHQQRLIAELGELGAKLVFDENGLVTFVQMSGPKFSDEELMRLNEFPDIRGLSLNRTKITDTGLAAFQGLSKLETLTVIYTPITDESIDDLKSVENASRLFLCGTEITPDGARRLQDAMASAKRDTVVDYRRGGLLGISGDPQVQSCIVVTVLANSAAAEAGIRPGDVILTCDGEQVGPFTSLTALLAKKGPGDKVSLTFSRGEQTLSREVALGTWEAD